MKDFPSSAPVNLLALFKLWLLRIAKHLANYHTLIPEFHLHLKTEGSIKRKMHFVVKTVAEELLLLLGLKWSWGPKQQSMPLLEIPHTFDV